MNIIYQKGDTYKYNVKCDDIMNEIYRMCTCVIGERILCFGNTNSASVLVFLT